MIKTQPRTRFTSAKFLLHLLTSAVILTSCASQSYKPQHPKSFTSDVCKKNFFQTLQKPTPQQLDDVTDAFNNGCFHETITLGQFLRRYHDDKFYKITSEAAEIFTPEGTFTDYVMEDFERGFLTVLISLSYLNLHNEEAALVELRRGYDEKNAQLYNYGDDPVLNLLLAALWDRFDTSISRPYWKKLLEIPKTPKTVTQFAEERLQQIDLKPSDRTRWSIAGYGYLPELDWDIDVLQHEKGPYKFKTKSPLPEACRDPSTLIVPTESWALKINARYKPGYHPLMYTKSLIRLPIGIGYGILGFSTGAAIGVGGCGLAMYAKDAADELCGLSLTAAGHIMKKSGDLVGYTLGPDMRRWRKMPMTIAISTQPQGFVPVCKEPLTSFRKTIQLTQYQPPSESEVGVR